MISFETKLHEQANSCKFPILSLKNMKTKKVFCAILPRLFAQLNSISYLEREIQIYFPSS